jgi:hypothetical protein
VLIGRERERAQLSSAAAEGQSGRGALVLLAGEAGVGKTAFGRSVLASSGLAVFEGAAMVRGGVAYWPLTSRCMAAPAGTCSVTRRDSVTA